MAAAGSAVGLGNIWRFPYLAAKNGGGVFLFVYLIMVLTFGFALLTTEVAIGRKTKQGPLTAYGVINKKFGFNGLLAWLVPVIILPYYCTTPIKMYKHILKNRIKKINIQTNLGKYFFKKGIILIIITV